MAEAAEAAPAVPAADAEQPQEENGGGWGEMLKTAQQVVLIYMVISFFNPFKTSNPQRSANSTGPVGYTNVFASGEPMELHVYVAEQEDFANVDQAASLVWHQTGWSYGDWEAGNDQDGYFYYNTTIPVSEAVQNNGTLYAHFCVESVASLVGNDDLDEANAVVAKPRTPQRSCGKHRLTRLHQRPKVVAKKNLLTGDTTETPQADDKVGTQIESEAVATDSDLITFWHTNLTLALVTEFSNIQPTGGSLPPPLAKRITFDNKTRKFIPPVEANDFWLFRSDMTPINKTTLELPLHLAFGPISLLRWQLYEQMEQSFQQQKSMGTQGDGDSETFRRMLLETNVYLLGVTFAVSILHTIFDILAFKNDISFWRNRKTMQGLSVRTIFMSIICQGIIFLYLMDQETSWMILCSSGVGLVIEIWKLRKAAKISLDWDNKLLGIVPLIKYEDRDDYVSETRQYDELAFWYLSRLLFPLFACYVVYSLMYQEHKSWYSFVVGTLAGGVYTFGFIMMTPQLFINYKLKSVAHLPWRMLTYKALNTFIDDLFAFIIKMPTMHRLACFRDDLIFFVYVYQRWIYPVDHKRYNEFGLAPKTDEEDQAEVEGEENTAAEIDGQAGSDTGDKGIAGAEGLRQRAPQPDTAT
eukprot:m.77821 g.77821  ORF g.77821 m.77821 type:complete len:640 (+) comp14563_c1_seq3:130-2049(+)